MRNRTVSVDKLLDQIDAEDPKKVSTMPAADQQVVMNAFAWFMNVSTSVLIIFVNKQLMSDSGLGFHYATTLCAMHYLVCTVSMWTSQGMGLVKRVEIPFADLVLFTVTANASIVSLNLSLMINSVGFYQIAKLLIIPFVCLVEYVWLGRRFTPRVVAAVVVVVMGVGIVTVSNVEFRTILGLLVAGISVVSSGMQQILCRSVQQKNKIASHELLAKTAPAQGLSLLLIGPLLDWYVSGDWVSSYEYNVPAFMWLFASCSIAVLVNVSQFMCLGRFSAVSFQVLGHAKTVLVLLGGWMIFKEVVTLKQLAGMGIAVAGMVWYGAESSKVPPVGGGPVGRRDRTKGSDVDVEEHLLKGEEAEAGRFASEKKETV